MKAYMGQCLLCGFSAPEFECLYKLSTESTFFWKETWAHGSWCLPTCMKNWVQIPSMHIQTGAWRCTPVVLTLWWLRRTGGSLGRVGQQPGCRACDPVSRGKAKLIEEDACCPPLVSTGRPASLWTCTRICRHHMSTQSPYKEDTGSGQKLI